MPVTPARPSRRPWLTRIAAGAAAGALVLPLGLSPADAGPSRAPAPGAAGAGDPYFPKYGNGGYDVRHYAIHIRYALGNHKLVGDTTLRARATQDLSRFDLDLQLPTRRVWVDGRRATFSRHGRELVITPRSPIVSGDAFTVRVTYAGFPAQVASHGIGAWWTTSDGALAAGEPEVATLWFPSNDHPRDKATFDIFATTAAGKQVISNGLLIGKVRHGKQRTWHWRSPDPMATYLATVVIGDYDIERGRSRGGIPYLYAMTRHMKGAMARNARSSLRITPRVVDFYTRKFGFYPFVNAGGTLVNASFGFSLENQTRPNYSKVFFTGGPDHEVVAHELAHMWWGDSVSVNRWRDIWLNEGFATWSSWFYLVNEPGTDMTVNDMFRSYYNSLKSYDEFWQVSISNPGPRRVFDWAVYARGAMALQALRNVMGTEAHNQLLREWASQHRNGDATVEEFEALAESISGLDLTTFFAEWLDQTDRPLPSADLGFPASMLPGKAGSPTLPRTMPAPGILHY
ncbi:MAG: M1 family metallopeptidase [Nocardioidaceae bacterium]